MVCRKFDEVFVGVYFVSLLRFMEATLALHGGVESREPEEQQAAQGHLCDHFDFRSDRVGFKGAPSARPWQRPFFLQLSSPHRERARPFALPGVWTPAGPWPGPRVKLRNGRSSIRMSFEAESHGDTATESGSRVLQGLPDGSFPCSLCQNATSWQILCTPRVPRMKWKACEKIRAEVAEVWDKLDTDKVQLVPILLY